MSVHFHTPKDILGIRNPPPIRRIPLITDVHPAPAIPSTHSCLMIRAASAVVAAGCVAKIETSWRSVHGGLLAYGRILGSLAPEHRLEDGVEGGVFSKVVGLGRKRGDCSEGEVEIGRVGREQT